MFPGPTISTHGSNEMLVVFNSDFIGTANGFNAFYEIREAFKENISLKGFKKFFVQSRSQIFRRAGSFVKYLKCFSPVSYLNN